MARETVLETICFTTRAMTSSLRAPSRLSAHSRAPSIDDDENRLSVLRASLQGLRFVDGERGQRAGGEVRDERRAGVRAGGRLGQPVSEQASFRPSLQSSSSATPSMSSLATQNVSYDASGDWAFDVAPIRANVDVSAQGTSNTERQTSVGATAVENAGTASSALLSQSLKDELKMLRALQKDTEREKTDLSARNAQSMKLLEDKDAVIDQLSKEKDLLVEEMERLSIALSQANANLGQSQTQVAELIEVGEGLKDELQRVEQDHDDAVLRLEERLMHREMELQEERKAREELEGNMDEVSAAMDAAEELMVEMEKRCAGLEGRYQRMAHFVRKRLGLGEKAMKAIMQAGGLGGCDDTISTNGRNVSGNEATDGVLNAMHVASDAEDTDDTDDTDDYPTSHAVLLNANKALEDALIRNAVPTTKVAVTVGDRVEEVAVPAFASSEAEEIAQLREQLDVAQQVALQAETELMMAKQGNDDGQDRRDASSGRSKHTDVDQNQMDLEHEAQRWRDDALEKIVDLEESLETMRSKLSATEAKNMELESLLETAMGNKEDVEADLVRSNKGAKETFVQMQKEIQSLRADLYATQRSLSSKEAKIASLQATQRFSLDISDWESLDIDSIDPCSSPVEFLVRSLQEAAQMQGELLESLSEHAFEREQGREALVMLERDMERAVGVLETLGGADARFAYESSVERAPATFTARLGAMDREEADMLRAQAEKAVAIQQGQAEAFSLLAKKAREKESEVKCKVKGYETVIREHEAFFADLETAVPAVRSSLAKLALVEEGEEAAAAILSAASSEDFGVAEAGLMGPSRGGIVELSIMVADKLSSIAQAISEGSLRTDRNKDDVKESNKSQEELASMRKRIKEVEAEYEAARTEARQATLALQELRRELHARGPIPSTPASVGVSATSGAILGDDLLGFVTRFEQLLEESGRLEDRIHELEDENSKLLSKGYSASESDQRLSEELDEARSEISALHATNKQQLEHIQALRQELEGAHASLESAVRKQSLMSERHVDDLSHLKDAYEGQIGQLKLAAEADRTHLLGMVDNAACEAVNLQETLAEAEENLSRLKKRLNDVEEEKKSLERERAGFLKCHVRRTDAMTTEAALQQAKEERQKRENLEKKLAAVTKHQNRLFESDCDDKADALDDETMAARLLDAQTRIDSLERRLIDGESIKAKWGAVDDELAHLENDVVNMMEV